MIMIFLPKAWHCKIFVLPSATMEPEAEGGVMNLGAWSGAEEEDAPKSREENILMEK